MKFRGLDARTQATRWGLFAVAIGIVVGATGPTAIAGLAGAWEANRSSLPWVFERTFAFLAYGAVAGSVIYGLLLSTKILDVGRPSPDHLRLAPGPGLVRRRPRGHPRDAPRARQERPVQPGRDRRSRPGSVRADVGAAGQVAFYLMAAVLASFYLRRRIGQRAWRLFHYLTFFAFIGATAHGLGAGDSASPWAWWLYVGSSVVVLFLFVYRISSAVVGRSSRPAAARPGRSDPPRPDGPPERAVRPGRAGTNPAVDSTR